MKIKEQFLQQIAEKDSLLEDLQVKANALADQEQGASEQLRKAEQERAFEVSQHENNIAK